MSPPEFLFIIVIIVLVYMYEGACNSCNVEVSAVESVLSIYLDMDSTDGTEVVRLPGQVLYPMRYLDSSQMSLTSGLMVDN